MKQKQKMQVALGVLFAILFVVWIIIPATVYSRVLGLTSNALGILAMVLSYRAEERNKKKSE